MPLTGDFTELRRLERDMLSLARGEQKDRLLEGPKAEIRVLQKEQFSKGIGPDGEPLAETKGGKPALVSKKLPYAFASRIDRGVLQFVGKSKRDMLRAHQFGHAFPIRLVAANKQFLSFNRRGQLVAESRIFNRRKQGPWGGKGELRRGAFQTFARGHTVGERVLKVRPIIPEGALPARYESAIGRGFANHLAQWAERVQR